MNVGLYAANSLDKFWRPLIEPAPSPAEWATAVAESIEILPETVRAATPSMDDVFVRILGEEQFGPYHWNLSRARRLYYQLKPILPRGLTRLLRQSQRTVAELSFQLDWPVEDRYARFLCAVVFSLLRKRQLDEFLHIGFWPEGKNFALVLTHDIETAAGQEHVRAVADLEARYGFTSSFNFVPERYVVDQSLVAVLRQRGFEIGIHGLKHDGKLFDSHEEFVRRAAKINRYLQQFKAVGFRSPLTHRNPEWMQALEIDYDLSFFDTDPYEPIPGGTMSLWPFHIGHFLELPYTLPQDYTLTAVLRETTPRLWLTKLEAVAAFHGMALLNTHPDYLREPRAWKMYEEFLRALSTRRDYWHALPAAVAQWWRAREMAPSLEDLPGGVAATVTRAGITVRPSHSPVHQLSIR
jgi:peptidoglycan/xylan/chitin deacetylase (PgdA/CDA1 family)